MSIDRIIYMRQRLDEGGQLSVQELHTLFDEIVYLHKTREALVYTIDRLTKRAETTTNE